LGSDTVSRDQSFSAKRAMVVQKVEQNRIPKVGVMDSSQRTSLRVASLGNLRTQFATRNGNDVKSALLRTRNAGSVAPKKKNAKGYVNPTISYGHAESPGTIPDPPRNVTLTNISPDLISVDFNPPINTGGKQISYYTITFTAIGRPDIVIPPIITTSLSNQISLPQGVTYTVTVVDTTIVGNSSPSTPLTITPTSNTTPTIIQFTETGEHTWIAPATVTSVTYLVVGGGGGGGGAYDDAGGGGGGGGLVLSETMNVTPGETYNVTVGSGGAGALRPAYVSGQGASTNSRDGSSGMSSSFDGIIAGGGGFGYKSRTFGGGGLQASGLTPPTGGNGGGSGGFGGPPGGGGGNKSPGTSYIGGAGIPNNITGTVITYGRGGNGGRQNSSGLDGGVNTGNGGGGGKSFSSNNIGGANGGSGIVVIQFNT
jgi:hypothetical protein